ncbi:nuclear transport factor 2 family protein [Xanthobacter dioxanivorans]|uniref:Nuclear transport factor 2 family protein n=1 Tax=Xanthobacter dioxanivorans TaxID=2528964 RepID=A0A974PPC2_9HYPH|nr:nuclear transport factor 2 family protein [Xanthobacter dioxanivorans]QRG07245.1 nuclear transport factor 2 family protein [Xanthobacter dioxanivorans]
MTDLTPLTIARRWLDVLAAGDFDAWPQVASKALIMRFPFAPPPLGLALEGYDDCINGTRGFWAAIKTFVFRDVELHTTEDPELIVGSARSESETAAGTPYENRYCFFVRVRGGKVIEHSEYFNPLPAIRAFGFPAS